MTDVAQSITTGNPTASVVGNIINNNTVVATIHIFLSLAFIFVAIAILGGRSDKKEEE